MKNFKKLLIILFSVFTFMPNVFSQVNIQYTSNSGSPLINKDVIACYNSDDMTNEVRIVITDDAADNAGVTISFPQGIQYRAGSISMLEQSGGLSISEQDISDLSNPVFSIMPADLSAGDFITFQWAREGNCEAVEYQSNGGVFKDKLFVDTDGGQVSDIDENLNSYDLLVPSLSLFGQGPITTTVGATVDRDITITNGGLGYLENFKFYILEYTGTTTTELKTPGGTVLIPVSIGDTLYYNIDVSVIQEFGDNDGFFENGEQILLTRSYTVFNCDDNDSYYNAYWGCPGKCQETGQLLQQTNIENLIPNIKVSLPNVNLDYCFNGDDAKVGGNAVIQTLKVENIGNGPATNFELTMFNFISGSGTGKNYFSSDPWIIKDENGNTLAVMDSYTALVSESYKQADCSSSTEANRVRQKATGFILQPNQTVYIEIPTYADNLQCYNCRDINFAWIFLSTSFEYQDQCQINNYNQPIKALFSTSHNFKNYSIEMPTDLVDGQEFNIELDYANAYTYVHNNDGYNFLEVDLSNTGLVYNGGATITMLRSGYVLPVTIIGDIVRLQFPNNKSFNGLIKIPMKASCALAGGTETVFFSHPTKWDDVQCPGDPPLQHYCSSTSYQMHCPNPCPKGGATPIKFNMERVNLGLEDLDDNGIPDGTGTAQPQDVNLHRGVNGDTVVGKWEIRVYENTVGPNAGVPFNHTYIEFDTKEVNESCSAQTPRTSWFTALPDAAVKIFPAGGGPVINCTVTPTVSNGIAKYDLTGCKPTFEGGDSIYVEAKYLVNAYYVQSGYYHYVADNEVYSSYIADPVGDNPSDENKYTCDHFDDFFNIFNIFNSPYMPSPQKINGCSNSFVINARTYIDLQAGNVWFPNEYRNFYIYDEFVVNWPPELEYRPGSAKFNGQVIDDADVSQVGNELKFSNLKKFYTSYGGSITPTDEVEGRSVTFSVNPNCNAIPGHVYSSYFNFKLIGNGINTPVSGWESNTNCSNINSGTAYLPYDAPLPGLSGGGEVQYTTKVVCWDVILNNGSNTEDADNSWFYLEDVKGILSNITVSTGGVNISVDANGFYQLGDNVKGASTVYTICAEANGCDTSKLVVKSGYGCSGYPSSINDYDCPMETTLTGIPLKSEVQVEVLEEPALPVTLCENHSIKVKISSAQAAYLDNPVLDIIVPQGSGISGDITVEYPSGSGNIEVVTPVITGSVYKINIENHSNVSQYGLKGTIDALSPEERSAIVSFSFITDCDFVSGSNFVFQAFGDRPCGDPAIGNGIKVKTSNMTVEGADQPYVTDIKFDNKITVDGCDANTLGFELSFIALNNSQTNPNDTVLVVLDNGLTYVNNSYICTSASNCLTYSNNYTDVNGKTVIVLTLPGTPIDLSGGAQSTSFDIQIENDELNSCDNIKEIEIKATSEVGNVPCSTEPSNTCPSLKVTTGQKSKEYRMRKTVVSFNSVDVTCNNSGDMSYSLDVQIDSIGLDAGEMIVVDIYCLDSNGNKGAYIESKTINGVVSIGNIANVNGSVSAGTCADENGLYFEISHSSNQGSENCICSEISQSFQIACCYFLDAGLDNEMCNDNNTNWDPEDDYITFDLNPAGGNISAEYSVSVDNGGTITPTSGTYGSATSFQLQNGSANGTTYTITITDNADANCTITTTVQQNSCSDVCKLLDIAKENEQCNNNGTSGDESDDYITFDLNPSGTNLSAGYIVSVDNGGIPTPSNGLYGNPVSFRLQDGSADGTVYNITVTDNIDPSCTISTTVSQNSCSTCTTSATFTTDCDDNGTLPNENDDYFNLVVTGTVTDGTGNYVVKIGTYTSASTASGSSVTITGNGQGGNPMLAADGSSTYTVRIEDASDSSCFTEYTIGPVDECSECPAPDCLKVQVKKNN